MSRGLTILFLLSGFCGAAGAQPLDLRQNHTVNYAIVEPGAGVSSDVEVRQTGKDNTTIAVENGAYNSLEVDQRGRDANYTHIEQFGLANNAVVIQQYDFRNKDNTNSGYIGETTPYGYLSEFNSGGVSILALTGAGNTLVSSFGRNH
jgi:hypothetical protein